MSFIQVMPASSSGANSVVNPKAAAAFALCFILFTGRISPARLNSPTNAVFGGNAKSVLAEKRAAASAASMELSVSRTPPATFM